MLIIKSEIECILMPQIVSNKDQSTDYCIALNMLVTPGDFHVEFI